MLKLVVLSEGMTGRTLELTESKATIGRTDDNTFSIAEPSVSSHHCEVLPQGKEVLVRDLNSTNGTFIGGEKITERTLKPGEILRLGQITMRLETDAPPPPAKKVFDRTTVIGGVSMSELDHTGDTDLFHPRGTGFSKRTDRGNQVFIVIAIVIGAVIGAMLLYVFRLATK
jgi:predicted component of type VI protein secretion system